MRNRLNQEELFKYSNGYWGDDFSYRWQKQNNAEIH